MLLYISTNDISELNDLIYAGANCEKVGVPSKSTKKQSKPGWGVRLAMQIKKSTICKIRPKMIKQTKDAGICRNKKEKATQKNNSTTWENEPECSSERRKTKEISAKGKTIQTKQDIPKQRKKILSTIGKFMTQKHTNNKTPEKPNDFGRNMATVV